MVDVVAILRTAMISAIFDLQVRLFGPSFQSVGLLVQKKFKINDQDGGRGSHLGLLIERIFAILIYKSLCYFLKSFVSVGLSIREFKIHFHDGSHGGHLGTILAIFHQQVPSILPSKFRVNWPIGSEEFNNIFSRWQLWQPPWISDLSVLAFFDLQKSKRKVQGVPQSQTAALPRPQEEEETDKSKQAQTEQTYEKH